jgi:hypothetical protein
VKGELPVAATVKVAVAGAVTVWLCGCAVIVGGTAFGEGFVGGVVEVGELEPPHPQAPTSSSEIAVKKTAQRIRSKNRLGWTFIHCPSGGKGISFLRAVDSMSLRPSRVVRFLLQEREFRSAGMPQLEAHDSIDRSCVSQGQTNVSGK